MAWRWTGRGIVFEPIVMQKVCLVVQDRRNVKQDIFRLSIVCQPGEHRGIDKEMTSGDVSVPVEGRGGYS